ALNTRKKAINGSRIHIMGIAYKKDVNDMRESPALDVMELLKQRGAELSYTDPFVPGLQHSDLNLASISEADAATRADCVVICTNHSAFDYASLPKQFPLVVDTRNALKGVGGENIF